MSLTLCYVLIAVVSTMFVANTASRREVVFWDLVVCGTLITLLLNQAGAFA